MVLHKGKHGLFYACTAFPLCKISLHFNEVKEKPLPREMQRAVESQCYRAIKPGSKLQVISKRTKVRGAWTIVTRFDYV